VNGAIDLAIDPAVYASAICTPRLLPTAQLVVDATSSNSGRQRRLHACPVKLEDDIWGP
jgi:hypothetical protein